MTCWATEVEFTLPGGRRRVRPDGVLQAPEIGVPVLMVEVDRSTMAPARVAAKFASYRELFRTRTRDNDPALAEAEASERMVHWWRRAYPGHTREGYPPVALVLSGAGATTLNNRAAQVGDLAAEFWRGRHHRTRYPDDWWRDYADAVPVLVASLDKLAELGPMGPVWWRYGRDGLHCLTDALDNPQDRAAYDQRQDDRRAEEDRLHRAFLQTLACTDCGAVPEREKVWVQETRRDWTHREGGTCHPCHAKRKAAKAHREDRLTDPWWEARLLHERLCPASRRQV